MTALTKEKKEELKKKYPKLYVTVLDNSDTPIVWHPITRSEHRKIIDDTINIDTTSEMVAERQLRITKACVVFPEGKELDDMLEEYAGVALAISEEIFTKSGFEVVNKTKEL